MNTTANKDYDQLKLVSINRPYACWHLLNEALKKVISSDIEQNIENVAPYKELLLEIDTKLDFVNPKKRNVLKRRCKDLIESIEHSI
jgi:alanyl-tRNA synthetase